jgi:glycosyltransferase involved in cell wall biosynthesis
MDILLQAWQRTANVRDQAVLVLVGSGTGQSDNLEEWARQFVQEHALSDTVIFAGAQQNVDEYLSAADYFVFPSRREGLPNSLLEAMATNLVCLVSDIGGNTDIIIDEQTGILIPVESIDCWAKALDSAILKPALALGENAGTLIKIKYSINRTVEKLEELYATDQVREK